jgi:hypothetical protein
MNKLLLISILLLNLTDANAQQTEVRLPKNALMRLNWGIFMRPRVVTNVINAEWGHTFGYQLPTRIQEPVGPPLIDCTTQPYVRELAKCRRLKPLIKALNDVQIMALNGMYSTICHIDQLLPRNRAVPRGRHG